MEWTLNIANLVGLALLGLFIKSYLPSYMQEKGKNLATKEDVAAITIKTEEVKVLFQKEMQEYSNDLTFTNDYAFNRYSILYARIYGIVVQSEYLRFFYKKHDIKDLNTADFPFIEIEKSETKTRTDISTGEISVSKRSIEDELTSFNKKELCDYIIKNSEYASPNLLKLAIAYRYAWTNYGESGNTKDQELLEAFNNSELELIKEIVKTIIMEYNEMRKIVKLKYSESELTSGQLEHMEFR